MCVAKEPSPQRGRAHPDHAGSLQGGVHTYAKFSGLHARCITTAFAKRQAPWSQLTPKQSGDRVASIPFLMPGMTANRTYMSCTGQSPPGHLKNVGFEVYAGQSRMPPS